MSEVVTSTDWRGVPCTMRYSSPKGKPVLVGDVTAGENVIRGGQAPHKEGSTGYVSTDRGSYYVGTVNAYWDPDFEPKNWCVFVAPYGSDEYEAYWWVDYKEPLGYLAALGVASMHSNAYIKAVEWD
jgi:hypothetical protein